MINMELADKNDLETEKTFLNTLPGSSLSYFVIETVWNDDTIRFGILQYLNNNKNEKLAWRGDLPIEDLKITAKKLEIQFSVFLNEVKQALCTDNGLPNFIYFLENNKFQWKKIQSFKLLYGTVDLELCENLEDQLMKNSIKLINELRKDLNMQKQLYCEFEIVHNDFKKSYNEFINKQNNNEKNLLSKFSELINTKREKISELQQLLYEQQNAELSIRNIKNGSTKLLKSQIDHAFSSSDDLTDASIDNKEEYEVENQPGTSKGKRILYSESSSQSQEILPKRQYLQKDLKNEINLLSNNDNKETSKKITDDDYNIATEELLNDI